MKPHEILHEIKQRSIAYLRENQVSTCSIDTLFKKIHACPDITKLSAPYATPTIQDIVTGEILPFTPLSADNMIPATIKQVIINFLAAGEETAAVSAARTAADQACKMAKQAVSYAKTSATSSTQAAKKSYTHRKSAAITSCLFTSAKQKAASAIYIATLSTAMYLSTRAIMSSFKCVSPMLRALEIAKQAVSHAETHAEQADRAAAGAPTRRSIMNKIVLTILHILDDRIHTTHDDEKSARLLDIRRITNYDLIHETSIRPCDFFLLWSTITTHYSTVWSKLFTHRQFLALSPTDQATAYESTDFISTMVDGWRVFQARENSLPVPPAPDYSRRDLHNQAQEAIMRTGPLQNTSDKDLEKLYSRVIAAYI